MSSPSPPFLEPEKTLIDGLAFLGLSLTQSNQTTWDFNEIQDRGYKFIATTNDDGWLVGGGENSESYKLMNEDSAHVEIMRIGSFDRSLGGLDVHIINQAILSGNLLIPSMAIMPTGVITNSDLPPELEVRFDMIRDDDKPCVEWTNWQIQFVHNQLMNHFKFPARFVPGPFHMTFVRKATFRSPQHKEDYFEHTKSVLEKWRLQGPTAVNALYLFKSRNEILQKFETNFHPPYDTPERIKMISKVLGI